MSGPVVTVTQADRDAYNCLMEDEGYDHEPAGAWHFARHREQAEAAFRAREAGLVGLLTKAVGDIATALMMTEGERLIPKWTAEYVAAINEYDARAKATSEAGEGV